MSDSKDKAQLGELLQVAADKAFDIGLPLLAKELINNVNEYFNTNQRTVLRRNFELKEWRRHRINMRLLMDQVSEIYRIANPLNIKYDLIETIYNRLMDTEEIYATERTPYWYPWFKRENLVILGWYHDYMYQVLIITLGIKIQQDDIPPVAVGECAQTFSWSDEAVDGLEHTLRNVYQDSKNNTQT